MSQNLKEARENFSHALLESDPEERRKLISTGMNKVFDGVLAISDDQKKVIKRLDEGEKSHAEIKEMIAANQVAVTRAAGYVWLHDLLGWWQRRGLVSKALIVLAILMIVPAQILDMAQAHLLDIKDFLQALGGAFTAAKGVVQ